MGTTTESPAATSQFGHTTTYSTCAPAGFLTPKLMRDWVASVARAERLGCLAESARLLTSELVTNVLLHGIGDVLVLVEVTGPAMRVTVYDDNPRLPALRIAAEDEETGRGLLTLSRVAHDWGLREPDDRHPAKGVWFLLNGHGDRTPIAEA